MKYRRFGTLDWNVSILGIALDGFPGDGNGLSNPQAAELAAMIRYALERGVNFIDLGYPVSADEQARVCALVSRALGDDLRDRVKLSLTLPVSGIQSSADLNRWLVDQLDWLDVDHVDFVFLGGLNRETWPVLKKAGGLDWADDAMARGLFRHLGFSFYDHFQVLKGILAGYWGWSAVRFQYSYLDVDHNPGYSGIQYAAKQSLAVVVTGALHQGRLSKEPPAVVVDLLSNAPVERSPIEWGLRFVWNHTGVSVVASTMKDWDGLKEKLELADAIEPGSLSVKEEVLIGRIREAYQKLRGVACPTCRPCMPCPEGIDVPRIFEIYNEAIMFHDISAGRRLYTRELHDASICKACGLCMERCAKRLPIVDLLQAAHRLLEQ